MTHRFFIILPPLLFLIPACSHLKEPELKSIENVRTENVGLNATTFNLDLHYFNPNKSRLQLKSASGIAWLEDQTLGEFTIDSLILIEPQSEFFAACPAKTGHESPAQKFCYTINKKRSADKN